MVMIGERFFYVGSSFCIYRGPPDDIEIIRMARHSLPNIAKLREFRLTHPYSEIWRTNGVNNLGKNVGI